VASHILFKASHVEGEEKSAVISKLCIGKDVDGVRVSGTCEDVFATSDGDKGI
jgi:hypothetical protein